jgi:hypothetical protein
VKLVLALVRIQALVACFGFLFSSSLSIRAHAEPSLAATPAVSSTPRGERMSFAVVIGNNKSLGRRRPELRYADDDAARYFEILQTMAPGRVTLLTDLDRDTERLFPTAHANAQPPTTEKLQAVGRKLTEQIRAAQASGHETELYFVFAGHGDVAEGEGFIEMTDTRFGAKDLEAWLRAIPFTRGHVILDSCNSFFMLGVRKPGGRHFATSEDAARTLSSRLPNVGVFLSTSADGEAFEWSEIQSGIFSHVVRSGLLGGADANADGSVSYVELAGFVDTATAEVRNPLMRPQVFARGPGAEDDAPIARLHSMTSVRWLELGAADSLRLRVRDQNGLPLLDAHTERARTLRIGLPEAWARGAVLERTPSTGGAPNAASSRFFYDIPDVPGTITLAALTVTEPTDAVRGPADTFQTLFATPFGPEAFAHYLMARASRPTHIFGVSSEDVQRMDLLLGQLALSEKGRRITESMGGIGFGVLLSGAGAGILDHGPGLSKDEKTEARVTGGIFLGLGSLITLGSSAALFVSTPSEEASEEFREIIREGGDPSVAFAKADDRLRTLVKERRDERYAAGFFGALFVLGSTTGLIWTEVAADEGADRMYPRLGWGLGIVGGAAMVGDAVFTQTPVDSLTKIWRDDPSLNQYQNRYQPTVSITEDGALLNLVGTF